MATGTETVVLGAGGFIGGALARKPGFRGLARRDVDLLSAGAGTWLAPRVEGRCVVFAPSVVPVPSRDHDSFTANIAMLDPLLAADPARVVYLSSEGVYPFESPVTEATRPAPCNAYGEMHLAREQRLGERFEDRLLVIRVSQVYGPGDPHNAYGPMRFVREAMQRGTITLFGNGEERRNHMHLEDAAGAIAALAGGARTGVLNLATDRSVTFEEVARMVADLVPARIVSAPRKQPVTHRDMDVGRLRAELPEFAPRGLERGLTDSIEEIGSHV